MKFQLDAQFARQIRIARIRLCLGRNGAPLTEATKAKALSRCHEHDGGVDSLLGLLSPARRREQGRVAVAAMKLRHAAALALVVWYLMRPASDLLR
jgi:hypothetical protein